MKQHRAFTEKQKKLLSGGAIAVFLLLGAALAEGTAIFGFVVALLIILFLG